MKAMGFGKPSLFISHLCLSGTEALFPAMDLNRRFKSIAAYGFF